MNGHALHRIGAIVRLRSSHAERLLGAPDSLFEWTFALTALGLVGAALLIAGRAQTPPPSTL